MLKICSLVLILMFIGCGCTVRIYEKAEALERTIEYDQNR